MAECDQKAVEAALAVCVTVVLDHATSPNLTTWRESLDRILPRTVGCSVRLASVFDAAQALVNAPREGIALALSRLRFELYIYYAHTAGDRVERWQEGAVNVAG